MTFKNKKIQKAISSLLILAVFAPSVLVFSTPTKAEAQAGIPSFDLTNAFLLSLNNVSAGTNAVVNTTSVGLQLKDLAKDIAKQLLMVVAKRALAEMTKSTVNWINSGFHGAPLFIENPSSFFKDIAKFQIKDFIQVTGYDNLQYPFGKQYALNVIAAYKKQLENNAAYSLSNVTNDPALLNSLRVDFNTGGWDAFLINTQYPQNNPIGYDIIASRNLSAKLSGTIKAPAERVNDLVNQGLGFLSPQTCPSNPDYNNGRNEFNRPDFKTNLKYDPPNVQPLVPLGPGGTMIRNPELIAYDAGYNKDVNMQKVEWEKENTCPGNLVSTTPGSVVGAQITKSLGTTQTQKELAAALGNSLGAIFDSLISKFMGDGLNSLATNINPTSSADDFTYYGNSLDDSIVAGSGENWTNQEIDLATFKREVSGGTTNGVDINGLPTTKQVSGAIELTKIELSLIDSTGAVNGVPNSNDLGLLQILERTWPVAKSLDMCIPGPNKGWEERLDAERDRIINSKLMRETASETDEKVKAVNGVMRDLRFAVSSFKDWINLKMITPRPFGFGLPSSVLFIDAVKGIDGNGQMLTELTNKKREKVTTIARLESIERALVPFTVQPTAGSVEEKALISLRKQFNALYASIGSTVSIEDLRSQLDLLSEKLQTLRKLDFDCNLERAAAGWSQSIDPKVGGVLPSEIGIPYLMEYWEVKGNNRREFVQKISTGSEADVFCEVPAASGYSHGDVIRQEDSNRIGPKGTNAYFPFTFRNPWGIDAGLPGYTDLPMVKAGNVYGDDTKNYDPIRIDIDCPIIFKTTDIDYKHAGETGY